MRKLTIVFHHAGGGHRSAAEALKATLSSQEHPWEVSVLDIQELLDPLDVVRRATGLRIQDTYNVILRKGWTRFTPQLLVVLQGTIRLYHSSIVKLLRNNWAEHPADLVLSVIPHFNREIAESLPAGGRKTSGTGTPFVTLITDLADYPPHFWIEPESEYIIVGTERARQQVSHWDTEDEEDCSYHQCGDQQGSLGCMQRVQDWKPMVNLHCHTE